MDRFIKRTLDIIFALVALVIFGPLIFLMTLIIMVTDFGPIFFRQARLGRDGKPFRIWKFRSMKVNAPDIRNTDGSAFSGDDDPRVTKIGKFMRKTSIDELPQFFNVLVGDMSLVGPRPDQVDQLQYYSDEEKEKLRVKPGITGLAQISGRNSISWEQRKKLDVEYVRGRNTKKDIQILVRTVPYVLLRRDVNATVPTVDFFYPYEGYPGITKWKAEKAFTAGEFVSKLDWDSGELGMPCGRVQVRPVSSAEEASAQATEAILDASRQGIQHLSVRIDVRNEILVGAYEQAGFERMDTITTFSKELGISAKSDDARLADRSDCHAVAEIARTAFTEDRFHRDSMISKDVADNLHATWGRNSVLGQAADATVVGVVDGDVAGFVTCKLHPDLEQTLGLRLGTIVLVATASQHQGKGLAKKMVQSAEAWFVEQGCTLVDVGTQGANIAALKLYQDLGYVEVAKSVSLRAFIVS